MRNGLIGCAVAALMFGAVVPAAAQAHIAYIVEDLGSMGGTDLVGLAINDNGEIAGYGRLPDGTYHAFRWTPDGGIEDLGANGGWLSQAAAINGYGDVVGVYIDNFNEAHGFLAPRGGPMRDVSTSEHRIYRVNAITDDGRMTGMLAVPFAPFTHAYRSLPDGTVQDLGGEFVSVGMATNARGDVAGYDAHDIYGENTKRAFRFTEESGLVDLGTVGGVRSSGMSINSSRVVVGWSDATDNVWSRAFRARPGFAIEDLGTLGGRFAGANAINDAGTIVGYAEASYGWSAFVYTDADGMLDLRPRVPPALLQTRAIVGAYAINNRGQIVVSHMNHNFQYGTFRLTPVPDYEPPSVMATVDQPVLTPPDGRMVPVRVSVSATDNYDAAPACAIASVTNNEAPTAGLDPDVQIVDALNVYLRATRQGIGTGRTYTIAVRCSDFATNATMVNVEVRVPHDLR
jgi:probable HAF family extracellular repeat protein